jgi:hypothetical protein
MARRKLGRVLDLEKGRKRLAGIKSIDATLDLGNDITVDNYKKEVDKMEDNLAAYNTALSTVDDLYNVCIAQQDILKDWNERVLSGVATKFGKNSSQYEMAGGVKKSERKKAKSKPAE